MQLLETGLVKMLCSELPEVSAEQVAGGASLIFRQLSHQLDAQDFATLDTVIPESDELAAHAPEDVRVLSGSLSGINQAIGGDKLAQLGNLASLVNSFQHIGLRPDMVPRFVQLILGYVQQQGGDQVHQIVEKALKA